jgi:hypothetical protein
MKNIHVLPTDKPSRLFLKEKTLLLNNQYTLQEVFPKGKCQNIYITSDEEIKEGDWFIRDGLIHKCFRVYKTDIEFLTSIDSVYCGSNTFWRKEFCKKIILTTDQDLIKDGVQAIDDEFLEWFVKNPSCEHVSVQKRYSDFTVEPFVGYKIIIPQEEPKQETLEEAAEKESEKHHYAFGQQSEFYQLGFIEGAKWQAERMYSEEDMIEFAVWLYLEVGSNKGKERTNKELFNKWFEQFKKK